MGGWAIAQSPCNREPLKYSKNGDNSTVNTGT
jgi:hypothetical protein